MTPAWISFDEQRNEFVLNEHSKAVYRIFELAAQGFGTALIVQQLLKEGYPPMAAGRRKDAASWSRRYITLILESRAVLGELALGVKNSGTDDERKLTGSVVEGHYPAIANIQPLWTEVAAIRVARKDLSGKSRNRRGDFSNLFAGICRCGSCGAAMVINHRQAPSKISYLRCPERYITKRCSGGNTYQYQRLEGIVLDQLDALLFPPADFAPKQHATDTELVEARTRVDQIKRRINNLLDQAEDEGFTEVRDRLVLRREELRAAEAAVRELQDKSIMQNADLSVEEYVAQIKAKRREASSDDVAIRTKARSEMRLRLQRLIGSMTFNSDRSVLVAFDLPSGGAAELTIFHQGPPLLTWKIDPNLMGLSKNPQGGLRVAETLGAKYDFSDSTPTDFSHLAPKGKGNLPA